ncbi:MAG: DinB family protein [Jatrophihabitans sp.]
MTEREAGPALLVTLDEVWQRLTSRLDGLTQDEYLWEPAARAWSVREEDGRWQAQWGQRAAV